MVTMNKYEPPDLTLSPKGRKNCGPGCLAARLRGRRIGPRAEASFSLIEQGHVRSRSARACADGLRNHQGRCPGQSFRQPQAERLSALRLPASSEHQRQNII